jgi:hypothetical protein
MARLPGFQPIGSDTKNTQPIAVDHSPSRARGS